MRTLIIVLIVLTMTTGLFAKKVATLPEILDPAMVKAENGRLYVLQRTSIFIYSLKDYKLIKTFGKQGEGPREFMINPFGAPMSLIVYRDQLVINSVNKLSYFTLDGKYIDEQTVPPNTVFSPIGKGYVGVGAALDGNRNARPSLAFRLFDEQFKPHTLLYRTDIKVGDLRNVLLPMEALHYEPVYQNKIFVVNSRKGLVIDCYDFDGKKLYTIEKEYEKQKVTREYKESAKNWFRTDPVFKRIWDMVKSGLTFSEYYPAIMDISIDNDRLYVITNKMENGKNECIIMDLKGQTLGSTFLPIPSHDYYTYYPLLYTIDNNRYYYLKENPDDEVWEVHVETILK